MNFLASSLGLPLRELDYPSLFNPAPQGDYVGSNVYEARGTSEVDIMKAAKLLEQANNEPNVISANAYLRTW
ncbi:hypothetical protein [Caballeronia insecticola]|uniref:hypothetical protein n=1 Tax=Caballeronia insecticola TaxID=758793 RepID=UPI0005C77451|nr:hypothetical protein [Caballeronia insecticola]